VARVDLEDAAATRLRGPAERDVDAHGLRRDHDGRSGSVEPGHQGLEFGVVGHGVDCRAHSFRALVGVEVAAMLLGQRRPTRVVKRQHGPPSRSGHRRDTWEKADVKVTQWFWRRPLSAVVQAFANHGFVVERLVEPQPTEQALARFPEELAKAVGVPWFIVYRLRLAQAVG
jgi:hypothetical protein